MTIATERVNVHRACRTIRRIIDEIHAGLRAAAIHPQTPGHAVRWTPSTIKGAPPSSENSVAYTSRSIAEHLGMRADDSLELCLLLMELQEKGFITPRALQSMVQGGLSLRSFRSLARQLNA